MKIGIIVEGREERESFSIVVKKINIVGSTIYEPLYAPICPKATPKQIAKAAESRIRILCAKGVDRIIISLDLEDLNFCPGDWARQIEHACNELGYKNVNVVIKNKKFENWLIADTEAFDKLKEFSPSKNFKRKIIDNADNIDDAETMISSIKSGVFRYHKGKDGCKIANVCNPLRIAENSRSFRRFLRLINHEDYKNQSQKKNK